jgi:hypothetical protein
VFADTIILLSIVASLLIFLDFFISENLKKEISTWAIRVWSKLEDWSRITMLEWLSIPNLRAFVCVLSFLCTAATVTHLLKIERTLFFFGRDPLTLGLFAASVVFLSAIWKLMTKQKMQRVERIILVVSAISPFLAVSLYLLWMKSPSTKPLVPLGILAVAMGISLVAAFVLAWMMIVRVLLLLIQLTEFVIRRIAEYQRGPLLAISVLTATIVLLYKTFVP